MVTPSSSPGAPKPVKLRTSCDLCQTLKVRCSQEKPSCFRCAKNRQVCIYSPLRRIGRPREEHQPEASYHQLQHRCGIQG